MLLSPWELVHIFILIYLAQGQDTFNCEWGIEEHVRRFVRVPENAPVGSVAFEVNVSRPDMLRLNSPKKENLAFLSPIPVTETKGHVLVASQLDRLTADDGSSVLKYSLFCGNNPVSQQVTVYIDDVNNHRPVFLDRNITVSVDELTPVGLVVLSEIRVYDEDKSNTANSEVELFLESQTAFVVHENYTDLESLQLSTHNKRKRTSTRNSRDFNKAMLRRQENVHYFSMNDDKKGEIQLIQALDYDFGARRFELLVVAKDMGQPPLSSSATVVVNVIDNDDSNPKFTAKRYKANVFEHSGTESKQNIMEEIITEPSAIKAYDGDRGIDAALQYSILKGEFSSYFSIDLNSGQLFLVKHLDRESLKEDTMIIHLLARQVDNIGREASAEVHITIKDVNDHLPSFENDIYAISIVENLPAGFSVVQVSASDPDIDENREFIYYVNKNNTPLTVNPETGWLTVTNQSMLDREESGLLTLQVCTKQKRPLANNFNNVDEKQGRELFGGLNNAHILKGTTQSSVTFPPVPDKVTPAVISVQSISPQVRSLPPSALLRERLHIVGNTPTLEKGPLSVTGPIEKPFLSRKENSFGRLLASRRLLSQGKQLFREDVNLNNTHEEKDHIIAKREAFNNKKLNKIIDKTLNNRIELRNTSKTPCATIRLTLLDANDNNPVFIPSNHYEFIIMDDIEIGKVVGTVKAVDNDSGVNGVVKYRLQKQAQEDDSYLSNINQFIIDEKTGVLRVTSLVTAGEITLFVEGSDSPSSPSETRTSLAIVSITIKSYNSFEPQFIGAPYDFWVGADAPIGTSVGQIRVAGTDDRDIVFDMFHSYNEVVPFGIEETSGIVAVTKVLQDFTREEYKLEAFVLANLVNTDQNYFELSTNVTIHIAPSSRAGSDKDIIIKFSVPENLAGGKVGSVIKSLLEMGVRIPRDPRLQLVSPDMRELFMLDENGVLFTVSALDYEEKNSYTLVIASERTSLLFYVSIQVEDLNDNAPQFNAVKYEGSIEENSPRGTQIKITPSIVVTDLDAYEGSSFKVFLNGPSTHLFTLIEDSKEVMFIGEALDREEKASYHFILKAIDDGNLTSTANLTITVEDTNDNSPEFIMRTDDFEPRYIQGKSTSREINVDGNVWNINEGKDSTLSIPESIPVGSRITRVSATDKDSEAFAKIEYNLNMETMFHILANNSAGNSKISNDFTIEPKTGSVIVTQKLQPNTFYLLNITASDNGGLTALLNIPVSVFDVNDKPPKFKQQSYTFEILEGEYVFSEIGSVNAEDQDSGDNGKLIYSIVLDDYEDAESLPFRIVETTGKILLSGNIDREKQEKYEFTVQVEDGGIPSLSDVAKVIVLIDDVNDHAPEFIDYNEMASATDGSFLITPFYRASIEESAPPGSVITKVQASDLDSNKTGNGIILYKLLDSSSLAIDSQYGTVYTINRLDYETEPLLQAKIVAHDMGKPSLSSTALLSVVIEDVENELSVRIFPQELYEVRAYENNKINERLARIQLNPSITKGKTFYLQLVDSFMVSVVYLDSLSGDLSLVKSLDREERNQYKFKIQAVEIHKGRALQHNLYSEPKNRRRNISDEITSILLLPSSTTEITTVEVTTLTTHNIINTTGTTAPVKAPKGTSRSKLFTKKITGSRFGEVEALALNEAWVHLIVNDINDNPPMFLPASAPLVAAISADAMLGDTVAKVEAVDADEGINKELRYAIVPTTISAQSISSYFALNNLTGELKVAGDLREIVGQKVSFDIKATDRDGDREGNNSTTSAFIHVLAQSSQLILELNAPPTEIHLHVDSLQRTLSNISGHEVRIQKVTPHVDGDAAMIQKTDVYIFGVDRLTKEFIPSKILRESLRHRYNKIDSLLPNEISMKGIRAPLPQSTEQFLKGAELAILIGALVVFLACISAIVCLCFKQRKKRRKPMPLPPGLTLGVTAQGPVPILSLPYNGHYPGPYTHMSEHSDSSESVNSPQQDRTYSYQMGEKLARQLPIRTFNRVPDIHTRSGRAKTPVTHIDDDNWQWKVRQRRESNGNIVEEEEHPHPHSHACSHHSPTTQVGQRTKSKGTHWHIRNHDIENEEPRGAVRVSHFTTTQTLRPNHTIAQESSETRENASCCTASRPPSPDSLEREPPRISTRRSTNNRLASDVTEL